MRVRAKYTYWPWKQGDEFDVIEETEHFYTIVSHAGSCAGGWYKKRFDVVEELNPTQAAMKLLIDQGYSIAPPKPKLTGTTYIYKVEDHAVFSSSSLLKNRSPIAVVNWTEGDGL